MKTLSIDIETRSGADISKCGVYRYAEDPEFDVLLFGVSLDGDPVTVYDVANGELPPEEILRALDNPAILKWAYNASFERVCLSEWLRRTQPELAPGYRGLPFLNPEGWRCSMVLGAYNGYPLGLGAIGSVLGLEKQKLSEGKELIRKFCVPKKENGKTDSHTSDNGHWFRMTGVEGGKGGDGQQTLFAKRRFIQPQEAPADWELFIQYNRRDVETEREIQVRLRRIPVPERVWQEYALDQEMNDRGIAIDRDFVEAAVKLDGEVRAKLTEEMRRRTGLENPGSVLQLKWWLAERGPRVVSLGKKEAQAMLEETEDEEVREVLKLRLQLAKSSVRKYEAMRSAVCRDGRCRGMFQFYGAPRSGRWAGRIVQLQNLPQNHMPDLDEARALVKAGDGEMLELLYGDVPQVLSELIRTAFVPGGHACFAVSDFSAIEARVLAHLAGEKWREKVFLAGGDIYAESASRMFGVPVQKHGINGDLRQKGKIAELALGYGGAKGALKSMGALELGLKEGELDDLVYAWRGANPKIVAFWAEVGDAAKTAIRNGAAEELEHLKFEFRDGTLRITLPSGRALNYVGAELERGLYGDEVIRYDGLDTTKHWTKLETYGPKLTENIVQAVSRDILADALARLRDYPVVGHVHDEVIVECEDPKEAEAISALMSRSPDWLPDLKLRAEGYSCETYRKD